MPDLFKTNWETDDALGDSLNEQLAHHFLKRRRDDLLSRVYEIAGHVSYYPFSYKFERGEVAGEAVMFILRRLEKEPEWVLTYPGEWELSRYVRGICWNVSKLLHRRASRELSLPAGFDVGSPPDPSTIVEISDQVEWLHRIMPSLPPSDQTILFHRLAGHTWEHISRNEEISVNALYQRFHRLMRKLRELAHNDE